MSESKSPESNDLSVEELLSRYAAGIEENQTFRIIADRLGGLIYQSSLRRSGQRDIAHEVTQTVFLIMARKAKSLSKHRHLLAWVHTTAKFETIQLLRTHQRRRDREQRALTNAEAMIEPAQQHEVLEILDQSLDRLTRSERELIFMKYLEGRSYDSITRKTGRSQSAEKMKIKRALAKMSAWLQSKGFTLSLTGLGLLLSTEGAKAAPLPALTASCTAVKTYTLPLTKSFLNTLQTAHPIKITAATSLAAIVCTAIPAASLTSQINTLQTQATESRTGASQLSPPTLSTSRKSIHSVVDDLLLANPDRISPANLARRYAIALEDDDELGQFRFEQILSRMNPDQLKAIGLAFHQSDLGESYEFNLKHKLGEFLPEDWTFEQRIRFLVSIKSYGKLPNYIFDDWMNKDPDAAISWLTAIRGSSAIQGVGLRDDYENLLWSTVLRHMARKSPQEALAHTEGLSPNEKGRVLWALSTTIPHQDFDLAISLAISAPAQQRKNWITEILEQEKALEHIPDLKIWMEKLGFNKQDIVAGIQHCLWQRPRPIRQLDLEGLISWVEKNSPDTEWEGLLWNSNLFRTFDNPKDKIREWVENSPPSPAKDVILSNAIETQLLNNWTTDQGLQELGFLLSNLSLPKTLERSTRALRAVAEHESPQIRKKTHALISAYILTKEDEK